MQMMSETAGKSADSKGVHMGKRLLSIFVLTKISGKSGQSWCKTGNVNSTLKCCPNRMVAMNS